MKTFLPLLVTKALSLQYVHFTVYDKWVMVTYLFQLLYSLYSLACVINPQYSNPQSFDQVFDIFSTQSSTSSNLIEYQFGQLNPQNESLFAYDSQQLNDSASSILQSINQSYPISPGYLLAVLRAHNATDPGVSDPESDDPNRSTSTTSNNPPNTALAMFVPSLLSESFVCLTDLL